MNQHIVITVRGGAVQDVSNLPSGWNAQIIDWDDLETDPSSDLRRRLAEITISSDSPLEQAVASYIVERYQFDAEIESFFSDLCEYGCVSGMVGGLIYYAETHSFFDTYYGEIEDLRSEVEEQTGVPLHLTGDLKNALAWFGFEESARRLMERLS